MRLLRYLWAFPTTSLGLLFVPLVLVSRGRLGVVNGVLEIHGGLITQFLKWCAPLADEVSAMTLGHVVLGRSQECLEATRKHERVHVRQCEQWGPAFVPAYIAAGLWALMRGADAYHGNYFEQQAYAEEATTIITPERDQRLSCPSRIPR
jgi:hypothetical protein